MSLRLPADAAHGFGGLAIDRNAPIRFRLDGRTIEAFKGDTVLSAVLAAGIDTVGTFGEWPIGLTPDFAPYVALRDGTRLPMDRLPVTDGLALATTGRRRFSFRRTSSLRLTIDGMGDPPWLRDTPVETITTDVLVIGGGVAGLAAADEAVRAKKNVVLIERLPRLGGEARFFGPVGDDQTPESATRELLDGLTAAPSVRIFSSAEAFAIQGNTVRVHHIADGRARVISITARHIVLATGARQRLPVFPGNRLPGVITATAAYELSRYYGVVLARTAIVATQGNYSYRLAMRLRDTGIDVRRIADTRVTAQSRFIDFAKASGLTIGRGQFVASASALRQGLAVALADTGTRQAGEPIEAGQLIVSGAFQPDLALWMLAGGSTHWHEGALRPRGTLDHTMLVGSAAGYRTLRACLASGRAAIREFAGAPPQPIADVELGAEFETPESPATIADAIAGAPSFYDTGASLIHRLPPGAKPILSREAGSPTIADVAASVELGMTLPADAGALAEERGAPGGELLATEWKPAPADSSDNPPWLAGRFGADTIRRRLIVDDRRRFERGALVYSNTTARDPALAIGAIVDAAPEGKAGGIALMSAAALRKHDRFIVEGLDGPSPARLAD